MWMSVRKSQGSKKAKLIGIRLDKIPNEMIIVIFLYLEIPELFSSLRLVCKNFNDLVICPNFFESWAKDVNSYEFVSINRLDVRKMEEFQKEYDKLMKKTSIEYINSRLFNLHCEEESIKMPCLSEESPIDYYLVFRCFDKIGRKPYWHYVSVGLTRIYDLSEEQDELLGKYERVRNCTMFKYEYSFRVYENRAKSVEEMGESPPSWCMSLMDNLSVYQYKSGRDFDVGHYIPCNGPIGMGDGVEDTKLVTIGFRLDPELKPVKTYNLQPEYVGFLELCGLTNKETEAGRYWSLGKTLNLIYGTGKPAIIEMGRREGLREEEMKIVEEGIQRDGSSCASLSFLDNCLIRFYHPDLEEEIVGEEEKWKRFFIDKDKTDFNNKKNVENEEEEEEEEEKKIIGEKKDGLQTQILEDGSKKKTLKLEIWSQYYETFLRVFRSRISHNEELEVKGKSNQTVLFFPTKQNAGDEPKFSFFEEEGVIICVVDPVDVDKVEVVEFAEYIRLEYKDYDLVFESVKEKEIRPFEDIKW